MPDTIQPSRIVSELLESALPHQRALVGILAIADQCQIDSVPLLHGLAAELPGRYGAPIQVLAEKIGGGASPLNAIVGDWEETDSPAPVTQQLKTDAFNPRLLPSPIVLAMQLAGANNSWSSFCSRVMHRAPLYRSASTTGDESWATKNLRVVFRLSVFLAIFSFFLIKILPEFSKMLEEFQIAIPKPLALTGQIGEVIAQYWWIVPLLLIATIPFCRSAIRRSLRRFSQLSWQRVEVPDSVLRQRSLAIIAEHAPTEKPVSDWASLANQNLISRKDVKSLSMTDNPETQAWLLRWSAVHRHDRMETRAALLGRSFLVIVHVALGSLVFLVCLSVFSLLITLMNELSRW